METFHGNRAYDDLWLVAFAWWGEFERRTRYHFAATAASICRTLAFAAAASFRGRYGCWRLPQHPLAL